jgi:protein-disulfide isomerase
MLRTLAIVTILLCFCASVLGQKTGYEAAGVVNGESISADEVRNVAAVDLQDLENRRAQFEIQLERDKQAALENALEKIITGRVLAAEAAERKLSVDELVTREVDAVRFVDSLKNKYAAKSYLEPARTPISTAGRPSHGPLEAPVTLVEFADFQCPYCGGLSPTLKQIQEDYKDALRVVYFQFPLADIHPEAEKAAEASLCAYEQNKFWELHDAMFGDQQNLSSEELIRKASELSIDLDAFKACLDEGKYFPEIRADMNEGVKAGVEGTPAMFINGRFLIGNVPYDEIQKVIEDELHRIRQK